MKLSIFANKYNIIPFWPQHNQLTACSRISIDSFCPFSSSHRLLLQWRTLCSSRKVERQLEEFQHVQSVINWILCIRPTICQSILHLSSGKYDLLDRSTWCPWDFINTLQFSRALYMKICLWSNRKCLFNSICTLYFESDFLFFPFRNES